MRIRSYRIKTLSLILVPVLTVTVFSEFAQAQTGSSADSSQGVELRPGKLNGRLTLGELEIVSIWGRTASAQGDPRLSSSGGKPQGDDPASYIWILESDESYRMSFNQVRIAPRRTSDILTYNVGARETHPVSYQETTTADLEIAMRELQYLITPSSGTIKSIRLDFSSQNEGNFVSGQLRETLELTAEQAVQATLPVQQSDTMNVSGRVEIIDDEGQTGVVILENREVSAADSQVSWVVEPPALATLSGTVSFTGTTVQAETIRPRISYQNPAAPIRTRDEQAGTFTDENAPVGAAFLGIDVNFADGSGTSLGRDEISLTSGDNTANYETQILDQPFRVSVSSETQPTRFYLSARRRNSPSYWDFSWQYLTSSGATSEFSLKTNAESNWQLSDLTSYFSETGDSGVTSSGSVQRNLSGIEFDGANQDTKVLPELKFARVPITFDAIEPAGAQPYVISNPSFNGVRVDDSGARDNSVRIRANSNDSDESASLIAFAPQGSLYRVSATADVLDPATNITTRPGFGEFDFFVPELDETGTGRHCHVTQSEEKCSRVSLCYQNIEQAGEIGIVSIPLGLNPPEGYELFTNPAPTPSADYHTVTSNAVAASDSKVEVCIWHNVEQMEEKGIPLSAVKLGVVKMGAASDADCGEGGTLIGPNWCDIRTPGQLLEEDTSPSITLCGQERDHQGVVCGITDASALKTATVLVPTEPAEEPQINCTLGDVEENGVPVPPPLELSQQYDTGLQVGDFLAEFSWQGLDKDDPSALDSFVQDVMDIMEAIYLPELSADRLSDDGHCRVRGILQGVSDRLNELVTEHSCREKASIQGVLAGRAYCTILTKYPSVTAPAALIPATSVSAACQDYFSPICEESFNDLSVAQCEAFTMSPFDVVFNTARQSTCVFVAQ